MSLATRFRSTLRRVPDGLRRPATIRTAAGAETTGTVLEGVLPDETRRFDGASTAQQATRQLALLAAGLAFGPAVGMQLEVGGVTWALTEVGVIEPTDAGAPILYRLTVER